MHRDYANTSDIQIKIFDDRITIFSPGKLYGGLTIEEIKTDSYQSHIRNKLIAEAFYLTKNIEKYGSGFIRIRKELESYPELSEQLHVPAKTIERWIKKLRDENKIIFKGAPKTGGYFINGGN